MVKKGALGSLCISFIVLSLGQNPSQKHNRGEVSLANRKLETSEQGRWPLAVSESRCSTHCAVSWGDCHAHGRGNKGNLFSVNRKGTEPPGP